MLVNTTENNEMAGELTVIKTNFYTAINNARFQLLQNQIPVKIAVFLKNKQG